jgi:hypothetical protein
MSKMLEPLLASSGFALGTKASDVRQLRDQLKKAPDAGDKPAIIELSRRIVALAQTSRAKN